VAGLCHDQSKYFQGAWNGYETQGDPQTRGQEQAFDDAQVCVASDVDGSSQDDRSPEDHGQEVNHQTEDRGPQVDRKAEAHQA
jgi:hypothetical protein